MSGELQRHLSEDELIDYILEELSEAETTAIEQHLEYCSACTERLDAFFEAQESFPEQAWAVRRGAFIERLREQVQATSSVLVLFKRGWQWLTGKQPSVDLSNDDVSRGRRIGNWRLIQPPQAGFAFADDAPSPLAVTTTLPDEQGHITLQLHIIPEYVAAAHRWIWRLRFALESAAPQAMVYVGIGSEHEQTTGFRDLQPDQFVEFQIDPPIDKPAWLHIEWKTPAGDWVTKEIELPFKDEMTGRG